MTSFEQYTVAELKAYARANNFRGFSIHKRKKDLIRFIKSQVEKTPKKIKRPTGKKNKVANDFIKTSSIKKRLEILKLMKNPEVKRLAKKLKVESRDPNEIKFILTFDLNYLKAMKDDEMYITGYYLDKFYNLHYDRFDKHNSEAYYRNKRVNQYKNKYLKSLDPSTFSDIHNYIRFIKKEFKIVPYVEIHTKKSLPEDINDLILAFSA